MDWIAAGFSEDVFWACTPRQVARHFEGARKRMRRDHNARMEQARTIAAFQSVKPPRIKDLLVDVDSKPRTRQSWQEIKAALMLVLPPNG